MFSLFCDLLFLLNSPLLSSFKKEKVSKKKIFAGICFIFLVLRSFVSSQFPFAFFFQKRKSKQKENVCKNLIFLCYLIGYLLKILIIEAIHSLPPRGRGTACGGRSLRHNGFSTRHIPTDFPSLPRSPSVAPRQLPPEGSLWANATLKPHR